jgi:hypothetical protein
MAGGEKELKLWIDDVRPAPEGQGYTVCKSVKLAKQIIEYNETIVHRYSVYLFEKILVFRNKFTRKLQIKR